MTGIKGNAIFLLDMWLLIFLGKFLLLWHFREFLCYCLLVLGKFLVELHQRRKVIRAHNEQFPRKKGPGNCYVLNALLAALKCIKIKEESITRTCETHRYFNVMSIYCLRQLSTEAVKKCPKAFMQRKLLNCVTNYYSDQKLAPLLNGYVLGGISRAFYF